MDHFAISIPERMSKMKNSLLDLNKEILISLKYLVNLKRNSTEIINNLNSITTPGNYLKEFMDVNSFILNYLSFLTEINYKFEMLEMSQRTFVNSLSFSKTANSEMLAQNLNKLDSHFSCESFLNLELNEPRANPKKVTPVQLSKLDSLPVKSSKGKKSRKKKSKDCKETQCNNKNGAINNSNNSNNNNNNNNNNDDDDDDNNNENSNNNKKNNSSSKKKKNNNNNGKNNNNKTNNNSNSDSNYSKCNRSNKNSNSKLVDDSCNTDNNIHTTKIEQKSDSGSNCNSINFSKKEIDFEIKKDMLSCNNLDENKSNCLKQKVSDSKMILPSKNFLNDINIKNVKQTSSTNESYSILLYSPNKFTSNKVVSSETQPSLKNTSVERILPTDINDSGEVSKYYNFIQNSNDKSLKLIEFKKSEVKINENEDEDEDEDDIKPANIPRKLGEEYNITIEHIQSPSEFYISVIIDQSGLLTELEKKLKVIPENKIKTFSKNIKDRKAYLCKEIGNYALYYSKCDEFWCRVKIINWCLTFKDDFVNVFLLDYGESKCVSIDDLQPMPECFKKYPACIQRCHLFNVFPLDMDENIQTLSWEKESSEKMKSLTENSKIIKIKIAPNDCYHPRDSLPVTLWLVDQGNKCVNELLVKSKCAIQRSDLIAKNEITVEENENLRSWNPMKEDFESYQNLYELDFNDPATFIYGYVGKDYERICPHFAKTGYCFKGRACRKEHQKLDPLGFTTDQEEVYKNSFNLLSVPPPNSILNVQVTCILTFNQFYCIPKDRTLSFSDEEDLQSLLKFMNNSENIHEMKKLLIPPSVGQIVIARYSRDHSWYRCRVLESEPEKDMYTVLFVDYGNTEILRLSEIRAIEARYLHLPFQSMRCSIFGIDRNPEVPLEDVMDYLNERMGDGYISIEIVTRLPGDDISLLVRVFDHIGRNIGDDLIANKYSIFKEELVISSDSLSMPG